MINVATTGFLSPWTDYDFSGQWGPVRYIKDAFGWVHIEGLISSSPYGSGSPTQIMFQLPAGYRPGASKSLMFGCWSYEPSAEQIARIDVDTNGNFIYIAGGRQWISLSTIHYYAAA